MSWLHRDIRGSRERGAADRIEGALRSGGYWTIRMLALHAGASYWTAQRVCMRLVTGGAVKREFGAGSDCGGHPGFIYRWGE